MERNRASGYIRTAADDRTAEDEQRRRIENAAFEMGCELADIHKDTGSGSSLDRHGLNSLLRSAKEKKIDLVLVHSSEVLSTDNNSLTELLETFSTLNVRVFSVSEKRFLNAPLDTLNNLSREIYNTLSEMEQNGVDLLNSKEHNQRNDEKDPTKKLQNKIIEAYLDIQPENRPRI